MRRPNKCVGKKAYNDRSKALAYIKKIYLTQKRKLRFYECPTCLDFHITSKPPFREMTKYYKRWDKPIKKTKAEIVKESKKIINKQWTEFCTLFRKYCKEHNIKPNKKTTILKGVLPREQRLKILAEMKRKQSIFNKLIDYAKRLLS